MPTKTEIIEAGARAFYEFSPLTSWDDLNRASTETAENHRKHMESAYSAMLPLIKAQLAAEVWALFQEEHRLWRGMAFYEAVRIIEDFEL